MIDSLYSTTCQICKNDIFDGDDIQVESGEPVHTVCYTVLHDKELVCGYCSSPFNDEKGVVISIASHGLVKMHIDCYACVDCDTVENLTINKVNNAKTGVEEYIPICENCSKCYVCKSREYTNGRFFSDGNYTKRHIVICDDCIGTSQDEELDT